MAHDIVLDCAPLHTTENSLNHSRFRFGFAFLDFLDGCASAPPPSSASSAGALLPRPALLAPREPAFLGSIVCYTPQAHRYPYGPHTHTHTHIHTRTHTVTPSPEVQNTPMPKASEIRRRLAGLRLHRLRSLLVGWLILELGELRCELGGDLLQVCMCHAQKYW